MNYLEIAKDGWKALRAGEVVADPAAWKKHQVSVNQVVAALGALVLFAKVVGYDVHMDDQTLGQVGVGLFGLVNWLFTVVTTDKIGLMGQRAPSTVVVTPAGVVALDGATGNVATGVRAASGAQVGGVTADDRTPVAMRRGSDDPAQSGNYPGGA